jgi:alkanesulfonate monooxygenase SsuD/methylene tetrahydromethanopterin reductase-like flavin-dependent oxidoreductase (luciferase family)
MKFDIFSEIQIAKPWPANHEQKVILDSIEQAKVADKAGFEVWWQVEHHGSPQFSYSAIPDLILGAIALNTTRLRVGHAGVLAPFKINHPLKVAERAATLDILSDGRLELGLARSSVKEWETFGADLETSREQLKEAFEMIPLMWTDEKFSWNSKLITIPEREVTPHPVQKPHPRLWQTSSGPESFRTAGEHGVGVLGTTLLNPVYYMKVMFEEYEKGLASCEKPAGQVPNRQKGVFTFVHVAESRQQAIESGAAWSALWYVYFASVNFNTPLDIWLSAIRAGLNPHTTRDFKFKDRSKPYQGADPTDMTIADDEVPVIALLKRMARGDQISNEEAHEVLESVDSVIIGDPDQCTKKFQAYKDIGTDRMMCLMQFGRIKHEDVVRSEILSGEFVIPRFAS